MVKQYYECHITINSDGSGCEGAEGDYYCKLVEDNGWIYSEINGDPDLGKGVKCYATRQFNVTKFGFDLVLESLTNMSFLLQENDVPVVREKVELVMYDKRYKT